VEPAHVPVEGISVACILIRPNVGIDKNQPVGKSVLPTSCTRLNMQEPDVPHDLKVSKRLDGTPEIGYPHDSITLMVVNFSEEELNLVVSFSDEENADRGTEHTFFSGSNK
jgi:hypothetical protein